MRAGKSLREFNPRARGATNPDTGAFEISEEPGEPSSILLVPQAWADFTRDGEDDLLISVINLSSGSARQVRLLLLTRSAPEAVLRVVASY